MRYGGVGVGRWPRNTGYTSTTVLSRKLISLQQRSGMERALACLLAALACLMTRASARDCLQCWREVCTTGGFVSNTIFNNDCCNCVNEPSDCVTSLTNADSSPDCCIIARERIFSRLSPQSEPNDVCNSSPPYPFITPTDIIPIAVTDLVTLPPGAYLVPGFKFQCRGCVDEVKLQGQIPGFSKPDNTIVNVTVNFTIWSRLVDTQSDEDSLFSLKQSVTIVATEEDIEPESARMDQLTITFSLPGNDELCFNEDEEFELSFEGTFGLQVILTRTDNNNMGSTYTLSPSEDNTCPELNDFYTATLVQEDRVPLMAIRIRPPQTLSSVTQLPSSSPSPLVTPPAATTTTTKRPSSSEVVPSVPHSDSQTAASPGVVIGVTSGSVAVLALIVLIFLAFLLISRRRRYDTDKVDGSGQREGAITPVGNSSHTVRLIYDDKMPSGEHGDMEPGAPQLEERRRILANPSRTEDDLENCIKQRRRNPELTANAAYNIHNHEKKTEACEAYQTVESDVVETTNPAYATTSGAGEELYIYTSTNEAYTATDVSTSDNVAYGTNTPITGSKSEEGEVDVGANEAYMPTVLSTVDNPAYGPMGGNDDSTLNYDYITT